MQTEIKCPKCNLEPKEYDSWQCSCSHIWNTFNTGGCCPKCNKRWEDSQCPECKKWSPHLDWYSGFDAVLNTALNNINVENN